MPFAQPQPFSQATRRTLSLPSLLMVGMVFGLFVPNLDAFVLRFTAMDPLAGFGPIAPERMGRLFSIGAVLLLSFLAFVVWLRSQRSRLAVLCLGLGLLGVVFAAGRILLDASSVLDPLRSQEFLGIWLMVLSLAITSALTTDAFVSGLVASLAFVASIKLIYNSIRFLLGYGYALLPGVTTLQADGGTLILQGAVVALTAGYALTAARSAKKGQSALATVVAVVLIIGIAASFRRLALIRALTVAAGGLALQSWLGGRLSRGAFSGLLFLLLMLVVAGVVGVGLFGVQSSSERLRSLSLSQDVGDAFSNALYIDDWQAWQESFLAGPWFGWGFGAEYGGVSRANIDEETGLAPPLHTGAFEMWPALGYPGAIFQVVLLVLLPVVRLALARSQRRVGWWVGPSAAFILFVGLFPFGPPFYVNHQYAILIGAILGLLVGEDRPVGLLRRAERESDDRP